MLNMHTSLYNAYDACQKTDTETVVLYRQLCRTQPAPRISFGLLTGQTGKVTSHMHLGTLDYGARTFVTGTTGAAAGGPEDRFRNGFAFRFATLFATPEAWEKAGDQEILQAFMELLEEELSGTSRLPAEA